MFAYQDVIQGQYKPGQYKNKQFNQQQQLNMKLRPSLTININEQDSFQNQFRKLDKEHEELKKKLICPINQKKIHNFFDQIDFKNSSKGTKYILNDLDNQIKEKMDTNQQLSKSGLHPFLQKNTKMMLSITHTSDVKKMDESINFQNKEQQKKIGIEQQLDKYRIKPLHIKNSVMQGKTPERLQKSSLYNIKTISAQIQINKCYQPDFSKLMKNNQIQITNLDPNIIRYVKRQKLKLKKTEAAPTFRYELTQVDDDVFQYQLNYN